MFSARFLSTGLRPWLTSNVPPALRRETSHRLRLPEKIVTPQAPVRRSPGVPGRSSPACGGPEVYPPVAGRKFTRLWRGRPVTYSSAYPDLYDPRGGRQLRTGILLANRPFSWHNTGERFKRGWFGWRADGASEAGRTEPQFPPTSGTRPRRLPGRRIACPLRDRLKT